jgi:hypothetical protein
MKRKLILAAALAAGSLAGLAQATPAVVAGTYYGGHPYDRDPGPAAYVQTPPPAPIYESAPAPRSGYVWSPGHYDWQDGRYVWLRGEWVPARAGYAWQAPHWQQRPDGSWFLVDGDWVPARRYSENRPYGDRDRDGVPNYYDRNDRNPYRY